MSLTQGTRGATSTCTTRSLLVVRHQLVRQGVCSVGEVAPGFEPVAISIVLARPYHYTRRATPSAYAYAYGDCTYTGHRPSRDQSSQSVFLASNVPFSVAYLVVAKVAKGRAIVATLLYYRSRVFLLSSLYNSLSTNTVLPFHIVTISSRMKIRIYHTPTYQSLTVCGLLF